MTFVATLDDQGRVLVPQEIREGLGLPEHAEVEVQILTKAASAPQAQDLSKMRATLALYAGSRRESFLADGYTSVEEYMNDLRGR